MRCLTTFLELVNEVTDRLNLTSDQAISRVGREINSRYKRVTSSIGLITSRRAQVTKVVTIGNKSVAFSGITHIDAVIDKSSGNDVILREATVDELREAPDVGEPPKTYAVFSTTTTTVTILLDGTPATAYTLYADGLATASTLAGSGSPAFAEDFHDILVFGAVADELRKMEKPQLADVAEADFERRLSDLRMFIAKSAYLDQFQGKTVNDKNWWKDRWT